MVREQRFPVPESFDKISPIARCWIYPGSHGSLNVVSAIQHSCNDFFYEVGYRLGTSGNEYNDAYGIERLQKYAEEFGLGDTTGLEITESEPKISDSDVVRSSIGQGTNNYTTAGLSRYISAVANGGVVYNLSLFEKQRMSTESWSRITSRRSGIRWKVSQTLRGRQSTME